MTGKKNIGSLAIPWIPTVRPENEESCYPYRKQVPSTNRLSPGWTFAPGRRPVDQTLIHEECVAIPLRDGVQVRLRTFNISPDLNEILN